MNYVMLSQFDKKLYQVHVRILGASDNDHVLTVMAYLKAHPVGLSDALRVATAGEARRRKLRLV